MTHSRRWWEGKEFACTAMVERYRPGDWLRCKNFGKYEGRCRLHATKAQLLTFAEKQLAAVKLSLK